jgi:hypothetical protein
MMNLSTVRRGTLAAALAATALCGTTAAQAGAHRYHSDCVLGR